MAKQYVITDRELELLRAKMAEDPSPNVTPSQVEKEAHDKARRFFIYRVLGWIDEVTR